MKTILIAGGSGLVGSRLSQLLSEQKYEVRHLSRRPSPKAEYPTFVWDLQKDYIDPKALDQVDAVINLAGAGIADKLWSDARKKLIIDSRVQSTNLLARKIQEGALKPSVYLSASAIGYYGHREDQWVEETDQPGEGFLAESTLAWEESIQAVVQTGVRTASFRIGIVLSTKGGAMEKMILPLKLGVAGYFGKGQQWYSWIHIDDLCNIFIEAIESKQYEGVYNAVSPSPETNKELTRKLRSAYQANALLLPGPAFVFRTVMGEMADVILNSTRVKADKIQQAGFQFEYPELELAMLDLIHYKK